MSLLRRVLAEVSAAHRLDDIAERLGLSRDEVDAMVEYWVRRGRLSLEEVGGCPAGGCSGCGPKKRAGCAGPGTAPLLVTIMARPPGGTGSGR